MTIIGPTAGMTIWARCTIWLSTPIDQIISLLGMPDATHFDVRSIHHPGVGDDYYDLEFYYGNSQGLGEYQHVRADRFPALRFMAQKGALPCRR